MTRALIWAIAILLTLFGFLGAGIYTIALLVSEDRAALTREYGSIFAFSVVSVLAGAIAITALTSRMPEHARLPNEWIAFGGFIVAVGLGAVLAFAGSLELTSPFLALLAMVSLFLFMGRLFTRWSLERRVVSREFFLPAVWGAIGAPLTAGAVQIGTVVLLVGAAVAGVYTADENLTNNFEPWLNQLAETADLSVIETPTVTFAALGVLGVTAPLTEELTKFLGVYLLFRKRIISRYGLFVAGAASGLGFAVVETLGYALMTAESWPQIMMLRAPVALIHVAATSIVALGWYQQRRNGGYALVGYFALAVLVHAAWNSLFVSMMVTAAGIDTPDQIEPAAAMMMLLIVGAMGAVLVGAVLWILGNARRLGRDPSSFNDADQIGHSSTSPNVMSTYQYGPEPMKGYMDV